MESKAKKKVNELVEEANQYAAKYYRECPSYGIIEYFDRWICENNYYNYIGTETDTTTRNSKEYWYCHSCYGILLQGYGVCESYALAMTRLLDAAGIRNLYVVGDAGGGHAWNYVQMPDGKWYMLDSTWNDVGNYSSKNYLLVKDDGVHSPEGKRFTAGKNFTFETRSGTDYARPGVETINISKAELLLKTKETYVLSMEDSYYDKFVKSWKSSNTKVAKVDKNGKVTAGSTPGMAEITVTLAGTGDTYTCKVYVYQITGLTFNNNKSSFTRIYENEDAVFDNNDVIEMDINVKQKNKTFTAREIWGKTDLYQTAVSSNNSIATADAEMGEKDTIKLKVYPKATGTATITVKFAGKTASFKVTVKQKLQNDWFDLSYTSTGYDGKVKKPSVNKSYTAPTALKVSKHYKMTYKNNKNAGTATVEIKGMGNYSGSVVKTFKINPQSLTDAVFKSCTSSVNYNGKAQKASTRVRLGTKTLKDGTDYVVKYSKDGIETEGLPVNKGVYTVAVEGKGNYAGVLSETKTFEIKAVMLNKVTVSCSASAKYTGNAVTPTIKVKIGKNVLPLSDYVITYCSADGTEVAAPVEKGTYKVIITPAGDNVVVSPTKSSIVKTFKVK